MECKSLRDSGHEIRKFDVAFFAASCDDLETNTRFAQSLDLDYPILSDPGCEAAAAYGVASEGSKFARRWTFYIDAEGTIQHIDTSVNPSSAGSDLAAKLAELGVPAAD
jgi:peroxiredoxin Q/BCP